MLESLRQGIGNIHRLNLDGAFPEPAVYRPRELYEELKRTVLYDAERGQWNESMSEEQDREGTHRYADTQLFGVLVEAQFNLERARALNDILKATSLYDAHREQWNSSLSEEQELRGTKRYTYAQLLGALAEAHFNPGGARALYENLKATPLYDAERGQWNEYRSKKRKLAGRSRYTYNQLLGVLVEARFNPERAQAFYEKLKSTPLYDAQHGHWNECMSKKQELEDTDRTANAQLLGVLVAAQFNAEGAPALYERLKATPLYDAQHGQWNWRMSKEQELKNTDRYAHVQLLGILVEAKLLSSLPRPLTEAIPPLPITEDW